jgi:hypothetical protein
VLAVRLSVDVPVPALSVTGLVDHEAVTPAGSPDTVRTTGPLKDPPPVNAKRSVAVAPCMTGIWPSAAEKLSVGCAADLGAAPTAIADADRVGAKAQPAMSRVTESSAESRLEIASI